MDQACPVVCHVTSVHHVPDPRIFLKQCRSLSEAGYTVYVIFSGDGANFAWDKIRPISIGPRISSRLRRLQLQPAIIRTLLRLRPQIVHFHDPELLPLMCLLQATVLSKCRFVYDVHEDYETLVRSYGFPWSATVWFYNVLARYAEKHMAILLAEDSYQSRFRLRHQVIHNFSVLQSSGGEVLRDNTFIYVGGVCETRGASTMIKTFGRLRSTDWKLEVIGQASPPELASHLRQLADHEAICPSQIQIHGYMPFPAAWERIRRAKAGLCLLSPEPNYLESLPTKVFDYLSAGVPVILSDFPYYRKFFAEVPGIHFVDAQNLTAVEAKLREFLNPELARRNLAEAADGQRVCREHFTWTAEAARLVSFYQREISAARGFATTV